MRIDHLLWFFLLAALCSSAWALKSDRSKVIHVSADQEQASLGSNGHITLTGHVKITQGSLGISGATAQGYENQANQLDHAVVKGSPARFHQTLDNGSLVKGSAATIRYLVSENTVILVGNAKVVQQGRGTFRGAKLTYNTDSGKIFGTGGRGGQVHMTFKPKPSPAKPAPASSGTR